METDGGYRAVQEVLRQLGRFFENCVCNFARAINWTRFLFYLAHRKKILYLKSKLINMYLKLSIIFEKNRRIVYFSSSHTRVFDCFSSCLPSDLFRPRDSVQIRITPRAIRRARVKRESNVMTEGTFSRSRERFVSASVGQLNASSKPIGDLIEP